MNNKIKAAVVGTGLLVGGTVIGWKCHKSLIIHMFKNKKFLAETVLPTILPQIKSRCIGIIGEEDFNKIMAIINEEGPKQ